MNGNVKTPQQNYRQALVTFFIIVITCLSLSSFAQPAPAKNIPEFTFYKMNGQSFSRKDLTKSKKPLIIFFDVTCDHCQNELKAMSERVEEFKKAQFYLVSMDNVPAIELFMKKYASKMASRSNVTLLTDLHKQFITRFKPVQYPATFVYGTDWKLIRYFGQNSKMTDIISAANK